MPFHPQDTIRRKRDNLPLSDHEIAAFIRAVTAREVSDAQTAAFLMAVFLRGLAPAELAALTKAMRFSASASAATSTSARCSSMAHARQRCAYNEIASRLEDG